MRFPIRSGDRPWHRWFAWFPVRIDHEWVWLEYVERMSENSQGYICHSYAAMRGKP